MDLVNTTSLAAALSTGFTGPTDVVGTLVARATFRIGDEGGLQPSKSAWPILKEPLWTEVGTFPCDMVPGHPGCDFVVTGVLKREAPVTTAKVTAKAGEFSAEIEVLGDRVWQSRGEDLVPSEPEPFTEMPLAWTRAYGGVSDYEGAEAPYVLNAKGRGYYVKREQAVGKPLPNLEWPDQKISRWDERPLPACFAPVVDPITWHLAKISIEASQAAKGENGDEEIQKIIAAAPERCALSASQPRMITPGVKVGDEISVEGVDARPLRFAIPGPLPFVRVEPGTEPFDAPLGISGLFLLLDQRVVVITYRAEFRYSYTKRMRRRAILMAGGAA